MLQAHQQHRANLHLGRFFGREKIVKDTAPRRRHMTRAMFAVRNLLDSHTFTLQSLLIVSSLDPDPNGSSFGTSSGNSATRTPLRDASRDRSFGKFRLHLAHEFPSRRYRYPAWASNPSDRTHTEPDTIQSPKNPARSPETVLRPPCCRPSRLPVSRTYYAISRMYMQYVAYAQVKTLPARIRQWRTISSWNSSNRTSPEKAHLKLVGNTMDNQLFADLVASMQQHNETIAGTRKPARVTKVDAQSIKVLRARAGLTQEKFAALIQVDLSTLRNWEQGRREPTGPAKALIRAITNDPKHVLKALEVGATVRKAG